MNRASRLLEELRLRGQHRQAEPVRPALGPGDRDADFKHDGGEIIFSLPQRLAGDFLIDAKGERIDKGRPLSSAIRARPDRAVLENGLSCISCHARGSSRRAISGAHVLKTGALPREPRDAAALYRRPEKTAA